ncbi:ATPase, F0 complex, subunit E, mitochondrial [Ascosphaera apis ARSEF 7405]|uniref:ATP synthase F(0) complex subunit e, mitochondrial n=1 Tax=Ascosphaera apis ARSEF 7405 TaxID=392613 RepID=A0A167VUA8_9EURO|nr:ATPase, F0 complex, subunit E, mitochondrial [Ascosphaera apis ARSEF 7405]
MASQGVNVLRWSALGAGLFYGFTHQRSLDSQAKAAQAEREYKHKEQLIEQARAEYRKKHPAPVVKDTPSPGGLITDPDDKRFDLEKFLLAKAEEN